MLQCCLCGKEYLENKMLVDEDTDNVYCENCYLSEYSNES
ncbi:hypothetical protein N752_12525 [Desulforamulus aquiferis]|nr:hypothetical protein N752_12525 [Desulforamulus aquiferis]